MAKKQTMKKTTTKKVAKKTAKKAPAKKAAPAAAPPAPAKPTRVASKAPVPPAPAPAPEAAAPVAAPAVEEGSAMVWADPGEFAVTVTLTREDLAAVAAHRGRTKVTEGDVREFVQGAVHDAIAEAEDDAHPRARGSMPLTEEKA